MRTHLHVASLLALSSAAFACSEAPAVFDYPELSGASALALVRSEEGIRYFAMPSTNSQIAINLETGRVQLLGFQEDLAHVGLVEGQVVPSGEALSAPLPPPVDVYSFDPSSPGWQLDDTPWMEATDFKLVPPNLCPTFKQPTEEIIEVPGLLQDAILLSGGSVIVIATSTSIGQAAVYSKDAGGTLVTLEQDDGSRIAITSTGDTIWIGGSRLWRSTEDGPWPAMVIADENDLNRETIHSIAGPAVLGGRSFEVVALTNEGSFWGWTGSELLHLADGYPTTQRSKAVVHDDAVFFSRYAVAERQRHDNFLIRVSDAGIESRLVTPEITDGNFRSNPVKELATIDGRLFMAAAGLGELISFEQGIFRRWNESSDTALHAVTGREGNLFLSNSRRNLFSGRAINGVFLECDDPIGRSSSDGGITFSRLFAASEGLVWVSQAVLLPGGYLTKILRLKELD